MPVFSIEAADDPMVLEVTEDFSGGQNSYIRASRVPQNQAAFLKNVIIQLSGQLRKRLGTRDIYSGYVSGMDKPIQGLIWFDTVDTDLLVAFANRKAWYFDGLAWQLYFDAELGSTTEQIDVVQLTDQLYFSDSTSPEISNWDGVTVNTIAGSPNATILEVITNRIAASGDATVPDAVYFSDILDPASWDLVNGQIRLGSGGGEPVVALRRWQKQILLVFCRRGVYAINCDPTAASAADFTVDTIHNTVGCVSRRSVCQVGQDIWFLSRNGIMSVQKQIGTSNDLISVPVSQPVQDIIERIRWEFVYKSAAACYNNYYILSIPVNSNEPDTVICFNYITQGFTIFDSWRAIVFCEQPFEGTTRLLMGCDTGEVRQWLEYLRSEQIEPALDYKDGLTSLTLPVTLPIVFPPGVDTEAVVITRAMIFGEPDVSKSGWYLNIEVTQGDGNLMVYVILDGSQPILLRTFTFSKSTFNLPFNLPILLPKKASWVSKAIPLHHLRRFREIQVKFVSNAGDFQLRRGSVTAFINAYEVQNE
jgi:hypothetical protein